MRAEALWATDPGRVKVNQFRRVSTVADVNGDGKDDLVTIEGVFLSRGDGTFQPTQSISNAKDVVVVTAGDFNGDGKSDVLISDMIAGTRVMLSNADGTFRSGPPDGSARSGLVADFNRDGRSDSSTSFSLGWRWHVRRGNPRLRPRGFFADLPATGYQTWLLGQASCWAG
jgi:hypothetical protein